MKKRFGFISNSSSSSFLIVNEKPIETYEELLEKIPDKEKSYIIWNDIQNCECVKLEVTPEVREIIFKFINNGSDAYFEAEEILKENGVIKPDFKDKKQYDQYNNKLNKEMMLVIQKYIDEIFIRSGEGYFYILEYSDETEIGGKIEHGNTFKNFKNCFQISHH